jgi:serine/threonine-protein kinase
MQPVPAPLGFDLVGGRYTLAGRIGEGCFATTHLAHDAVLGRPVAVKLLRPEFARDETAAARFEREARSAAFVSHHNTVDVFDYGEHGETFFIAMQYVPGRDLKRLMDDEGRLAPDEAAGLVRQVLAGIGAIHAAGIIHRDVKPQNVLLGRDGVARVTDFGVAYSSGARALTTDGTTVGTAAYMAPEQARGGVLTEATDLYAVGVVLFGLLTGRLPFARENTVDTMLAHLREMPPTPSAVAPDAGIPPALDALVLRALAKDPAERFASADEMERALARLAPPPVRPVIDLTPGGEAAMATSHLPAVRLAADGATGPAERARPVSPPPVARQAPAQRPLPPARRRAGPTWLAPSAAFGLALAALIGLVASQVAGGGDAGAEVPGLLATVPAGSTTQTPGGLASGAGP